MSLTFSDEPKLAEQQMHAVIFYLTTFGYIDGDFDAKEKAFVRDYIGTLVRERAESAMRGAEASVKAEVVQKFTQHFHEVFEGIDQSVKDLFNEAVAATDDQTDFVHTKLKVRCFEIFQGFDRPQQEQLLSTIDELVMADGVVHPAEAKFRAEIAALLDQEIDVELLEDDGGQPNVALRATAPVERTTANHPFFTPTEFHYSKDHDRILAQIGADRALLDRAMAVLDEQRARGKGKLAGQTNVSAFAGQDPFLDDHVWVVPDKPGARYLLTVLGDLHGCYSVLKATLMQSRFFDKVADYRRDPANHPRPLLVLLGDYIDRGLFSLNGVLRTVLQLFVTAPDLVYVLRGNHEYYIEFKGNFYGGVKPAEAINSLKPHLPMDVFRHYSRLFEALPTALLFDRILFAHGGIAKERLLKERYKDLSSLNDPDIRFQMLWSDPSSADVIPSDLQDKSSRFAFGKMQFKAFMQKLGCHTMVRGHEKVNAGFVRTYDDPYAQLFTLFSSGGSDNDDLPLGSSYRTVVPMALTIEHGPNGTTFTPWKPDYRTYNDPTRNSFFKLPPEIEYRKD